jgi:hypothetical protein
MSLGQEAQRRIPKKRRTKKEWQPTTSGGRRSLAAIKGGQRLGWLGGDKHKPKGVTQQCCSLKERENGAKLSLPEGGQAQLSHSPPKVAVLTARLGGDKLPLLHRRTKVAFILFEGGKEGHHLFRIKGAAPQLGGSKLMRAAYTEKSFL